MFKKIFFILSLGCIILLPLSVDAVGNLNDASKNLAPAATVAGYQEGDIGSITGKIINTALQLVGIIFLALMVYAGYLWMTAQGEESQIEKAQKIITSAIIGLVLTMSAYAITALITKKFNSPAEGGQTQSGPPWGAGSACVNGADCVSGVCAGSGNNLTCQ